jgi:phosphatidylinositol glycan class V
MTATGRSNTITQWSPYWSILIVFNCWKSLLSLIAFSTPSPAYDTSTTLALLHTNDRAHQDYSIRHSVVIKTLKTFCSSLTRWDAIYFSKIAERGYINEEEWAFGWGHSRAIVMTRQGLGSQSNPVYLLINGYSLVSHDSWIYPPREPIRRNN